MNRKTLMLPLLLLVLVLMSFTSSAMADGDGGSLQGTPPSSVASAPTYSLTVTFSPNPISIPAGSSKIVTYTLHNSGKSTFITKSCTLTVKWSTGQTVTGTCSIASHTVAPGASYIGKWTWSTGSKNPHGPSVWTVIVLGTVNGVSMQSHPGIQDITIT